MALLHSQTKKRNFFPVFAVVTFGLNLIGFLLLIFHWSMLQQITEKPPQNLVQLVDGRTITVGTQPKIQRHPEVIRRMVGETMTLMFTWSQKQPTQVIWDNTSALFSNSLKQKVASDIFQILPMNNIKTPLNNTESVFIIQKISQPEQIADGKWKLEILASSIIYNDSDKNGYKIPFNKQIIISTADDREISLPSNPLPIHSAISRLGEAKLQIDNICDIKEKKC